MVDDLAADFLRKSWILDGYFSCLFGKKGWGNVLKLILDLDFVVRELSKKN